MAKLTVNTSAVNESAKATKWLRTDIKFGTDWIQVGFMALDGDYADKNAQKIVNTFELTAENPSKSNKADNIRFSLKMTDNEVGTLDISDF